MTRKELEAALNNKSLLTDKHNPFKMNKTYKEDRTVISHNLVECLPHILSMNCILSLYKDLNPKHSPVYIAISISDFPIPASGVTKNSLIASSVMDKLVMVSGHTIGWHIFGENSVKIQAKVDSGNLIYLQDL